MNERHTGHSRTLLNAASEIHWLRELDHIWTRNNLWTGGWSFLQPPSVLRYSYHITIWIGLAGWFIRLLRRRSAAVFSDQQIMWLSAAFCVCMTAGLGWHMLQTQAAWGWMGANPWYAAAVLPWFLALVLQGSLHWPIGRLRFLIGLNLIVVFAAAEISGTYGRMIRAYSATQFGWTAFERLATFHSGLFATGTLLAATMIAILLTAIAFRCAASFVMRAREAAWAVDP